MTDIYVLRKSVHGFSAGTRVAVTPNPSDSSIQVEVLVQSDQYEDLVFDADWSDVVKLRNRRDEVPRVNRKQRRQALNKLFGGTVEA